MHILSKAFYLENKISNSSELISFFLIVVACNMYFYLLQHQHQHQQQKKNAQKM